MSNEVSDTYFPDTYFLAEISNEVSDTYFLLLPNEVSDTHFPRLSTSATDFSPVRARRR
jgi:hypothetical protein